MKLDTLRRFFDRKKRTKLYISTEDFLVTGYVCNPRESHDALLVDIGPYVIYSFARKETFHCSQNFKGLHLDDSTIVTRRFNTHRRHARGSRCREEYLEKAWEL